jgi:Protein of unknown function (DUF3631)/Protein of unknown function (DUF2786)
MALPPPSVCRRIRQLFARVGSTNANEAAIAREKLAELLASHNLTWNDLPAILADAVSTASPGKANPGKQAQQTPAEPPSVNVLDLVLRLIEDHISLGPNERMAVALWVLHTYAYHRYSVTPRLAVVSPVRGCGKTALMIILELLAWEADRNDSITAASIYYDLQKRTVLADEGDNLGLLNNPVLRAAFNSGHRRGGSVKRFVGGRARKYSTHMPLAVAAIGALPLPLLHRSVKIDMQRAPKKVTIRRLDEDDPAFAAAREEIRRWAAMCNLADDPEMPPALRNRVADNWRVLLAIADDLGHGETARLAAVALSARYTDEDAGVILLTDIRRIFCARQIERITSAALIEALLRLDDGLWSEWRGPKEDRPPTNISQPELASLLRNFGIRPRTIWPLKRGPDTRSSRGYVRSQFEAAWRAYCPTDDTPAQGSKIRRLTG